MAETVTDLPWLSKLELISMRDDKIVGIFVDRGIKIAISPHWGTSTRPVPGPTFHNTRFTNVWLSPLGILPRGAYHGEHHEVLHMPIADPKFFEAVERMIEKWAKS
jgi:hypothetical protein